MTGTLAKAPMIGGPMDGDTHDGPTFPPALVLDCPIIGKRHPAHGRYRYELTARGDYVCVGQVA